MQSLFLRFKEKNLNFIYFFLYFKLIYFLVFLDHFDVLILKILLKNNCNHIFKHPHGALGSIYQVVCVLVRVSLVKYIENSCRFYLFLN